MKNQQPLNDRINQLELRLDRLEKALSKQTVSENKAAKAPTSAFIPSKETTHPPESAPVHQPNPFIEWLKTDWLMKLGALLLLLALGWFVTYAFANNWIGPIGRITLGMVTGAMIMSGGHFLMTKFRGPGQVLTVLGGVMILLTIFAARSIYDFFTPGLALGMMTLVVIAMTIIAILNNARSVAYLALLGGLIVPFLTDSPQPNYVALMSYIFLLDLGILATVSFRPWRGLIVTGLIGTFLYSSTFNYLSDSMSWLFMGLFFTLFFVSTLVSILRSEVVKGSDLTTSGLNGLILLVWINEYVPRESASLILSGIVILLVAVSYVHLELNQKPQAVTLNASLAVLFLGTATAFELSGASLTIAYAIEVLLIVLLAALVVRNKKLARGFAILHLLPIGLSTDSIDSLRWAEKLFNQHFFALLVTAFSLAGTSWVLKRMPDNQRDKVQYLTGMIAGIYGMILIWDSSHILIDYDTTARMVSLIIYTLIGVALFFVGVRKTVRTYTLTGGILLALVVLRLLMVEVWLMPLGGRVVTFFAIGGLLVTTAFFQKRLRS